MLMSQIFKFLKRAIPTRERLPPPLTLLPECKRLPTKQPKAFAIPKPCGKHVRAWTESVQKFAAVTESLRSAHLLFVPFVTNEVRHR
jgi:hypothetical protein